MWQDFEIFFGIGKEWLSGREANIIYKTFLISVRVS